MNQQTQQWIQDTLLAAQLGEANEADVLQLRELLLHDSEARMLYLQMNHLDCMLESSGTSRRASKLQAKRLSFRPYLIPLVSAALAASITLLVTLHRNNVPQESSPPSSTLATLDSTLNAEFTQFSGDERGFKAGAYELKAGVAKLQFSNGTEVIIDAPSTFEMISENQMHLSFGKIWCYCPPSAYGFTVSTPGDKNIVDLGTEFGIHVTNSEITELHVFSGLVEVRQQGSPASPVLKNEAVFWQRRGDIIQLDAANEDKFITNKQLLSRRLTRYQRKLKKRDDLLLYYDFATLSTLENKALYATTESQPEVVDLLPSSGRHPLFQAATFTKNESHVGLQLPTPLRACTTNLWVKVDAFDKPFSALFNSQGWNNGCVHLQVTRNRAIESSLFGGSVIRSHVNSLTPHKWHMITATWNLETQEAHIYCDGYLLKKARSSSGAFPPWSIQSISYGTATIGHWKPVGLNSAPVRNFKGSIDEIHIFDRALNPSEVEQLYLEGKP
jgi:hypothetical protein